MHFCLGMAANIAAAHRHQFSPLPKTTNAQQPYRRPFLPYFLSSYSTSHTSIASSTPSTPASERSNGSGERSTFAMLEGRLEHKTSSKASSLDGSTSPTRNRKRSGSKGRTFFQLAHPPPAVKHRQRFSIRPKLLLQLQQISESTRPIPVLDVLPSVIFAPRLAKKFPRIFKGKDGLGADDLVIVRSQTYDRSSVPDSRAEKSTDNDDWNTRDFVAAFCQVRDGEGAALGNTEICLNHGPCWEATSKMNGVYEFISTDEQGRRTVARWVPKASSDHRRPMTTQRSSGASPLPETSKLNFSIVNPNSRRHPVMATLTRQSLSILDQYSIPDTPTFPHASASPIGSPVSDFGGRDADYDDMTTKPSTKVDIDEHLRTLIVITGLWVAFREGYSPNFRYNDPIFSSMTEAKAQQATQKSHTRRSLSINLGSLASGRAGNSDSGKAKRGSQLRPEIEGTSSASTVSASATAITTRATPRRTQSAGTAFMNRVNTRNISSAAKSSVPSPLATQSPVPSHKEKEMEDLTSPRQENGSLLDSPFTSPQPRQRRMTLGLRKESSYRSSLATASDMQNSEDSSTLVGGNGNKNGRMHRLLGFIRRTSGAHV